MNDITIQKFADVYYKEYSMYVLENRAIPSYIDGFKPVQRKLIYAALQLPKDKLVKVAELGSSISSYGYHHGEFSAQQACVLMAAPYNNNIPLFEPEGSFGTRLSPVAASPRYIYVSLSNQFKNIFLDDEVSDKKDEYEPITYLPILPMVLIQGQSGIAIGFATNILPRNIADVKKACIDYLSKGKIKTEIQLKYPFFNGTIEKLDEKKWCTKGLIEKKTKGKKIWYHITELPIGYDREKYFTKLSELSEKKLIIDFEENCKEGFDFTVYVTEEQAIKIDKDPMKFFGLIKYETENLTTLDENGKLRIFQSPEELVAAFCDYRLKKTIEYLAYKIKEFNEKLKILSLKKSFIIDVIDGVIDFKKLDRVDLLNHLLNKNLADKDICETVMSMPSYSFTKDNVLKLQNEIDKVNAEIKSLENTDAKDLFIERLKNLKV